MNLYDESNLAARYDTILNLILQLEGHEISTYISYDLLTSILHQQAIVFDNYLSAAYDEHVRSFNLIR